MSDGPKSIELVDDVLDLCSSFICPRSIRASREFRVYEMSSLVDTSLDSSTSQGQEIMQIETQIWVSLVCLIALGPIKKVHESRTSSTNINFQGF